jgi:hypothetical protein
MERITGIKIEAARREYVAAIGSKQEQAKRAELERLVYLARKQGPQ